MLDMLINSIKNKNIITFTYSNLPRTAEPHAIGVSRAGNIVLRCYQTEGGHIRPGHEWDLCDITKIQDLVVQDKSFLNARPNYKKGDKHMTAIYAEL